MATMTGRIRSPFLLVLVLGTLCTTAVAAPAANGTTHAGGHGGSSESAAPATVLGAGAARVNGAP